MSGRLGRWLLGLGVSGAALAYAASLPPPSSVLKPSRPLSSSSTAALHVRVDEPASTLLGQEERLMSWQDPKTQAAWILDGRPPIYYATGVGYYFCNYGFAGPYCAVQHASAATPAWITITSQPSLVRLHFSSYARQWLSGYSWFGKPLR